MSFLGSIGIDPQLLIAQLINFGLLLWILQRYLYRPIIERIEKDEKELTRAQVLSEELVNEKADFAKKRRQELRRSREEGERLIDEATSVAKGIETKAHQDALRELNKAVATAQDEATAEKESLIRGYKQELSQKASDRLIEGMLKGVPADTRLRIQDVFFDSLIADIGKLPVSAVQESAPRLFREIMGLVKQEGTTKGRASPTTAPEKIRQLVEQKMGPVILEYGIKPKAEQIDAIEQKLSDTFGFPFPVPVKAVKNEQLLAGFRLEVWGVLIERHLMQELTYGLENA